MSAERRSRYLRVVRPGSGAGSDAAATPPLPVEPPLTPPLWLDAAPGRAGGPGGAGASARADGTIPAQPGRSGVPRASTATGPGAGPVLGSPGAGSGVGADSTLRSDNTRGSFGSGGQGSSSPHIASPRSGFLGSGPLGSGAAHAGPCDEDPVGAALRASLHHAVDGVRPAPDSLARLHRAVPQRRALRRRAYGGAAVAASLALLGLTALHSLGPEAATSAATGPMGSLLPGAQASATKHGQGGLSTDSSTPGVPSAGGTAWDARGGRPGGTVLVPLPSGGITSVAASLTDGLPPGSTLAECNRSQLGKGAAGLASPDTSGIVYGSFAVSNVSATPCKISSAGSINVTAPVGTNVSRFTVAPHTAGDPAVSLPAPDPAHPAVALAPGQTYVVDFAFVPGVCTSNSSAGPTGTASSAPTTAGTASAGAAGSTGGSGSTAGTAGAATDGAGDSGAGTPTSSPGTPGGTSGTGGTGGSGNPSAPAGPSVQLAAVPAAGGAATSSTTLQGACAGTIYRTDPLAAPH